MQHNPISLLRQVTMFVATLALATSSSASDDPNDGKFFPRVVGGEPAPNGQYRWMVALAHAPTGDYHEDQFCGGVLVSAEWVLTAAHCVEGQKLGDIRIVIGTNDLNAVTRVLYPKAIIMHPSYFQRVTLGGDLALIQLRERITDIEPVRLIQTPLDSQPQGRIIGWGRTSFDQNAADPYPNLLQQADLPILSRATLNTLPFFQGRIRGDYIPAGQSNPVRAAFSGDSGGPLLVKDSNDEWIVAGIASYGSGGCGGDYDHITMFSDVGLRQEWIESVVSTANLFADAGHEPLVFERDESNGEPYFKFQVWPRAAGTAYIYPKNPSGARVQKVHHSSELFYQGSHPIFLDEDRGMLYKKLWLSEVVEHAPKYWVSPIPLDRIPLSTGPFPLAPYSQILANINSDIPTLFRVSGLVPNRSYALHQTDDFDVTGVNIYERDGTRLSKLALHRQDDRSTFVPSYPEVWIAADGFWIDRSIWLLTPDEEHGVSFGSTYAGTLSENSSQYHRPGTRVESLNVLDIGNELNTEVMIELYSSFDAEIAVFSKNWNETLQYLDDEGRNATERSIIYASDLQRGTVRINNFDADEFGSFSLSTRHVQSKTRLALGDIERRAITRADRSYNTGNGYTQYYEAIALNVTSTTQPVTVTVLGVNSFYPAYAIYEDPGSVLIDSISGRYCDFPQTTFTPKVGKTYELIVAAFDEDDLNGNYDVYYTRNDPFNSVEASEELAVKRSKQFPFQPRHGARVLTERQTRVALIDAYLDSRDKAKTAQ